MVRSNTASFNDVKKKLIHYKKNGIKLPEAFVNKYKQFNKITAHLEAIEKEYALKNDRCNILSNKTSSFQDNIEDARIINRDKWIGHNDIVFKLVDPPVRLSFSVPEGSPSMIFGIVETDNDGYQIQAVNDYDRVQDDTNDNSDNDEEVEESQ